MDIWNETVNWVNNSPLMIGLMWIMFIDVILGSARAIIEKKFNSSVGKKGVIIKVAMALTSVCAVFLDYAVDINFLAFIPQSICDALNIGQPGSCETVIILFGVYELTSILKNWSALGLPGSKKLEELLKKYTDELK